MTEPRPTIWQRVTYGLGRSAIFVVTRLPESWAYALAGGLGRLFYRCSGRRQRLAMHTLRNAFPDAPLAELETHARRSAAHVFQVALDSVLLTRAIERDRFDDAIELSGGYGMPEGAFVGATAHLGSWEFAAVMLARVTGRPAHSIVRGFRNPLIQRWMEDNRRRAGFLAHPKRGGIRSLTRALRDGNIVMQAADQNQRLRGVAAPFFGQIASTNRSVALLALKFDVPIVVGAAFRLNGRFRFECCLDPPFRPERTEDFEADVARATAEVNRRLEVLIRRRPDQYLWMHDRYKSAPEIDSQGRPIEPAP